MINKKVSEIRSNPEHIYKFLHAPLQGFNRVHIDTNFVLVFKINHTKKIVVLYHYAHHDEVYKWRPKGD
jgi:mRNA-degrading endonuclease RelE of RelBE toxin-antitoxin system